MSRLLIILGLVLLGIVGMAAVLGYFAYGNEATRSGRLVLDGLQQPAAIQWSEDGSVTVEATGEADLFAALGYVHGADHAWAMTLWRQAALGQLSQWFGPDYVGYDRHARTLGFSALAEETYEAISEEEKALLDAYARGTNLALASTAVTQQDEFAAHAREVRVFDQAFAPLGLLDLLGVGEKRVEVAIGVDQLGRGLDADARHAGDRRH